MKIFNLVLAIGLMGSAASAQDIAGDWQGTIDSGSAKLKIVLHIGKDGDSYKGTLDSPDQGASGIPVDKVTYDPPKLKLDISAVHGLYEGMVSSKGDHISGTWTQGQSLPLEFTRAKPESAEAKPAAPSDIDGTWSGSLDTGSARLRLVFTITNTADGLTATLESPDQGPARLTASSVTRSADNLTIVVQQIGGSFAGKISTGGESIEGKWKQHGSDFPLVLKRTKSAAGLERPRPQTPHPPFPYDSLDVGYENKQGSIRLSGTLTVPRGAGPFPAAILIPGSGPHDRDETIFGHKPFWVLADYLSRRGIAVLRYDARGVGRSQGVFGSATTADFATDVDAAVTFLRNRSDIDGLKIGLIGHSEGGLVAPMVAARDSAIAFTVLMAAPGLNMRDVLLQQQRLLLQANGATAEQIRQAADQERSIFKAIEEEKDAAVLEKRLQQELAGSQQPDLAAQIRAAGSPWFRFLLAYDPGAALRKLRCPVLAVNGTKDIQVAAGQNLPAICTALAEGVSQDFQVSELPGLNHLFQTASTGMPEEYAEIEETLAPAALAVIGNWLVEHTGRRAG